MKIPHRQCDGSNIRGFGWSTTLFLLTPSSPANSTTQSVKDFYNYYHGRNDSMISDQFNPFMRESTPPLLIDASAETHVAWGRCSFLGFEYDCVTRIYALVMLRMLDVAPYTVTVFKSDFPWAIRTFSGMGDAWFVADIDIDYWCDFLLDYTIKAYAQDFAGNKLDPPWEKRVDGPFAGVLRFFEWLASVVAAIADLVMRALSFLADLIVGIVKGIFQLIYDAILALLRGWGSSIMQKTSSIFDTYNQPSGIPTRLISDFERTLLALDLVLPLIVVIGIISAILLPFTITFGSLISVVVSVLVSLIISAVVPQVDDPQMERGSPRTILESMFAFLGVTHGTPDYLKAAIIAFSGSVIFGGIVGGAMGGIEAGMPGYIISLSALGILLVSVFAGLTIENMYNAEMEATHDETKKQRLTDEWNFNRVILMGFTFAALVLSVYGFAKGPEGYGALPGLFGMILSGIDLVYEAMKMGWFGGIHIP